MTVKEVGETRMKLCLDVVKTLNEFLSLPTNVPDKACVGCGDSAFELYDWYIEENNQVSDHLAAKYNVVFCVRCMNCKLDHGDIVLVSPLGAYAPVLDDDISCQYLMEFKKRFRGEKYRKMVLSGSRSWRTDGSEEVDGC